MRVKLGVGRMFAKRYPALRRQMSEQGLVLGYRQRGIPKVKLILLWMGAWTFFLFIALGNSMRFFHVSFLSQSLPFSESILHFFAFICFFFLKLSRNKVLFLIGSGFVLFLSNMYGAFLNGFDVVATLYAFRFFALIFSSIILSELFFELFKNRVASCFSFLLSAFASGLILGTMIFILFTDSSKFWVFLQHIGIVFNGDPHHHRFISVYFDPNYYCNISAIPFLISMALFQYSKKYRYLFLAGSFLLSSILTWSRSGLFVMVCLLLFLMARRTKFFTLLIVSKFGLRLSIITVFLAGLLGWVCWEDLRWFLNRLIHISTDGSAYCRALSFQYGLSIFEEHPLCGVGFGYLATRCLSITNLSSIDASIFATIISFGILLTLNIVLFLILIIGRKRHFISNLKIQSKFAYNFTINFYFYIIIVVIFSSLFNNVLYYPFWLMPVLILLLYLLKVAQMQGQDLLMKSCDRLPSIMAQPNNKAILNCKALY